MKCNKCNREIPTDSEFCPVCGNKTEERKTIKISLKKFIIGTLIILIFIAIISFMIFNKEKNNTANGAISNNEQNREVFEINQIGLFKGPNILEEKYNDKGDLIYCKYNWNNETKENKYNYSYDSKNRVIKITSNDNESTFLVNYDNEDKISEITTSYDIGEYKYIFHYHDDLIVEKYFSLADKYFSTARIDERVKNQFEGLIIIEEKEINGKTYVSLIDSDENDDLEEILIYEKNNINNSNSFEQYSFIPLQYINSMSMGKAQNILIEYTGFAGSFLPIFNYGNIIYDKKKQLISNEYAIQEYQYDNEGRILLDSSALSKSYYKYEKIDEKTYYRYIIIDGISESNYQALGMKSQYEFGKDKLYLDDEGKVYKYERFEENVIASEEFQKFKKEYLKYIDENKINSEKIKTECLQGYNFDTQSTNNQSYIENNVEDSTNEESIIKNTKIKESVNSSSSNNNVKNNNKQENIEAKSQEEIKKDTSFKMTSLEVTSSLTTNTEYYTLKGKVNVKLGKDADWSKYSNFTTTINGQKVSSSGDNIYDGYMWFYESYNPLNEGENKFDITVTDADGNTISKSVSVTYIPKEN